MPAIAPIRASDRGERRPRPIPKRVQLACRLMIYGDPAAGDDAKPLTFVQAARSVGIEPYRLRRWLDRTPVIQLIRRERAIFRRPLCCANESTLARVRDTSENGMAVIAAVRGLEDLDAAEIAQTRTQGQTPGVVIVISSPRDNTAPAPAPAPMIDARPMPTIEDGPRRDSAGNPIFNPNRDGCIDRD
jgi:hypothetical protein